jgi:hypothetical protein
MEYWRCVINRCFLAWGVGLGVFSAAAVVGAIACAIAAAATAGVAFIPCFLAVLAGMGIFVAVVLICVLISAMVMCLGETGTAPLAPLSGALPPGFGKGMDCPAARAALDAALQELAEAIQDLEDAMAATRKARRRLEAATVAAGIAIGAVAAAFFRPDLLAAAIAACVAALVLVRRHARALALAARRELEALRVVAEIEAKVAALQALVNSLCPTSDTPPSPAPDGEDPGGIVPVDLTPALT